MAEEVCVQMKEEQKESFSLSVCVLKNHSQKDMQIKGLVFCQIIFSFTAKEDLVAWEEAL